MNELWIVAGIVLGCVVLILFGRNGSITHILTAIVSYLLGSRRGKR
jgi:ABC-type molybdate transport system permease subunit